MKTTKEQRDGRIRVLESWDQDGERRLTDGFERDLIADVDEAGALMGRVRPILCGLAIEVEAKQKAEGTAYLTDAVAVKDEVVAFLKEPDA